MITDTRLLLPAGGAYYLPAPAQPPTPRPIRLPLTPAEEVMLEIAAQVDTRATLDEQRCFQVPRGIQKSMADKLVIAGLLERPNSRALRYQITERGRQRAKFIQQAEMPDLDGLSESQAALVTQAYRNLSALMGDLTMQGYLLYHEQGRGIERGQIAFYNPYGGQFDTYVLYRRRLGCVTWERVTYYRDNDPSQVELDAALINAAIGF